MPCLQQGCRMRVPSYGSKREVQWPLHFLLGAEQAMPCSLGLRQLSSICQPALLVGGQPQVGAVMLSSPLLAFVSC